MIDIVLTQMNSNLHNQAKAYIEYFLYCNDLRVNVSLFTDL